MNKLIRIENAMVKCGNETRNYYGTYFVIMELNGKVVSKTNKAKVAYRIAKNVSTNWKMFNQTF